MAGMARAELLKMNGLEAIAIAWAAFCIPTSMMMVLRSLFWSFMALERRADTAIERISIESTTAPRSRMFSAMVL